MKKSKKGFTIVELVIVIAVIGILSAILIPTFANLVGEAREAKIQSEVSSAYMAYAAAKADEGELVAQSAVVISKDITAQNADIYHYVANENAAWVKTTVPASYLDLGEYSGYHVYQVVTA